MHCLFLMKVQKKIVEYLRNANDQSITVMCEGASFVNLRMLGFNNVFLYFHAAEVSLIPITTTPVTILAIFLQPTCLQVYLLAKAR